MLTIENLIKTFTEKGKSAGEVRAVDDISLEVQEGQLFTLVGPSGCGKTTTLRSVAGLETPNAGRISVAGNTFFDSGKGRVVPPQNRGLGMVFQSYAIWPHMNVWKNVAFPLLVRDRATRPSRKEIDDRVGKVLSVVQLDALGDRQATDLSGGQQQRLALARALVMEPPLLLLDEPLSNLDAKLREEMRFELRRLQRDLNITAVYVTHDQVEALAMSNRIAVMRSGQIEQVGKPREIYERPQSRFVADFIGSSNLVPGTLIDRSPEGLANVRALGGRVSASIPKAVPSGSAVTLSLRPEHIRLTELSSANSAADTTDGDVTGKVVARAFVGEAVEHIVEVNDASLRVKTHAGQSLHEGTQVRIEVDSDWTVAIPDVDDN